MTLKSFRRITVKAKGKARAMSSLQVQPSAGEISRGFFSPMSLISGATGSSSTALQPKISPNSRIHYYVVDPELDNENKVKRRSRNSGKLAQLMDMPLEVFFEVTGSVPRTIIGCSSMYVVCRSRRNSSLLIYYNSRASLSTSGRRSPRSRPVAYGRQPGGTHRLCQTPHCV